MKAILIPITGFVACLGLFGQSKYEDRPAGLTAKGLAVIERYEKEAKQTLSHFDEELQNPNGRTFFVMTRIYEGSSHERIYVRVESKKGESYVGTIASEPVGPVRFQKDARLEVLSRDVVDWCIVMPNGEELGNLTGKATEALQAGVVVFVIGMTPKGGTFAQFRVVSVTNPRTQQEIREIVPDDVVAKVEREAKRRFGKLKAQDEKERFQFILVSFPDWEPLQK